MKLWYENLNDAMVDTGVTEAQLAEALSVTPRTVRNWRQKGVPEARLNDVQRALGVEAPLSTPTWEPTRQGLAWRRLADGETFVPQGDYPPPGYELVFLD